MVQTYILSDTCGYIGDLVGFFLAVRFPNNGIRTRIYHGMYTATYLTVCYGWRVGIVHSNFIITATAEATTDLTLPYLTLPYLTLNLVFIFLKYIILPYMRPTPAPNEPLKHMNPQFYIRKTDLTRRTHCSGRALLGTKIHPVGPCLTQFSIAKQTFPAT